MDQRLLLILIFAVSLASASGKKTKEEKLKKKFLSQIKNVCKDEYKKARRFLKKYNCHINEMKDKGKSWIVKSKVVELMCEKLKPTSITTVICNKHCTDPTTCKHIIGYEGNPRLHSVTYRYANKKKPKNIKLPITCVCDSKSDERNKTQQNLLCL